MVHPSVLHNKMELGNLDEFREWLRDNTNLSEGTIKLYVRTINHYFKLNSSLKIEHINRFITQSFRDKSSLYVKYAFKQYLDYVKKPNLYNHLVAIKQKARKKMGTYIPESMLRKLILNISREEYMDMASLQYATGARAREIITLKEENIDLEFEENVIRIILLGKGGKERPAFLDKRYAQLLKKYMKGQAGYLFLPDLAEHTDDDALDRFVNTKRTYYYDAIKKSSTSLGLANFGTHDFRRNVVEILKRKGVHIKTIQKLLGHISINTTARYFNESPEDVKQAALQHQTEG